MKPGEWYAIRRTRMVVLGWKEDQLRLIKYIESKEPITDADATVLESCQNEAQVYDEIIDMLNKMLEDRRKAQ